MRMHADQTDVTVEVVRRLVAEQFPPWRGLAVRPVASDGTENALFRVGVDVVLRLPLRPDPALRAELEREQEHARLAAAHLPVEVPEPLGIGEPGEGYPGPWAVYRWLPGERVDVAGTFDADALARDLVDVVTAFRGIDTGGRGWDGHGRGGPLVDKDDGVRDALARSTHLVDTARLGEAWRRCLEASRHTGADVWIHADLMPGNLLLRDGRLAAVIDYGTMTVGDPAVDLMPAWNLLPPGPRDTFRRALGVDDDEWERGRGWALLQAAVALPYYVHTNPGMARTAKHTLDALLD